MILVDTSVLIDFFKGKENSAVSKLENIVFQKIPFGINYYICQELLQGTRSENEFIKLKKYLDDLKFYYLLNGRESFAEAAQIYYKCRKKGITVNSTIDFLIIQIAIENNLSILHNDKDYNLIQKVVSHLNFL